MKGSYDLELVLASYLVAVIASFSAIYFGTRVRSLDGSNRSFWLGAGAICLGSGIWSMHFVGMSAYEMPMSMEMSFNLSLTVVSWILAVAASVLALRVITKTQVATARLLNSALVMGLGIFGMHYCGMYAMQMQPAIQYDAYIVALSGVIAVAASGAALWICRNIDRVPSQYEITIKIGAALVMGLAICGMHYTGMAAVSFPMDASMASDNTLRGNWMGIPTAIVASLFLMLLVYIAFQDFREMERAKVAEQEALKAAEHAAFHDLATGLPNRTTLEEQVLEKIRLSSVSNTDQPFSLLFVELSDYRALAKKRDESFLQAYSVGFAALLKQHWHGAETIFRSTSNGYVALFATTDRKLLHNAIQQLTDRCVTPLNIEGEPVYVNLGFGVSKYPASGANSKNLIRKAQQVQTRFRASSSNKPGTLQEQPA